MKICFVYKQTPESMRTFHLQPDSSNDCARMGQAQRVWQKILGRWLRTYLARATSSTPGCPLAVHFGLLRPWHGDAPGSGHRRTHRYTWQARVRRDAQCQCEKHWPRGSVSCFLRSIGQSSTQYGALCTAVPAPRTFSTAFSVIPGPGGWQQFTVIYRF